MEISHNKRQFTVLTLSLLKVLSSIPKVLSSPVISTHPIDQVYLQVIYGLLEYIT